MVTVVVPAASSTPAPTTIAVFALVHAIILRVVLMRVKVKHVSTVPFVAAVAAIMLASATGSAAAAALAERVTQIAAAEMATPRLAKNFRSFSTARSRRFLTVHSSSPSAAATSETGLTKKT